MSIGVYLVPSVKTFAYCALTGHGDLYPLVAIPPLLLRKNDYFRLDTDQNIQVQVGVDAITFKMECRVALGKTVSNEPPASFKLTQNSLK